jgi:predicted DNA-binding protein (MmcQ/YjbR family)
MDRQGVRAVCLALSGVTLDHPWGEDHDAYKVGGKMFAIIGGMGGLSFKASEIAFEVLTETGRARPAPYLARARWLHLDDPADWPDEELADHLRIAHALVASKLPKKLRTELGLTRSGAP